MAIKFYGLSTNSYDTDEGYVLIDNKGRYYNSTTTWADACDIRRQVYRQMGVTLTVITRHAWVNGDF